MTPTLQTGLEVFIFFWDLAYGKYEILSRISNTPRLRECDNTYE